MQMQLPPRYSSSGGQDRVEGKALEVVEDTGDSATTVCVGYMSSPSEAAVRAGWQ